MKQVRMKPTVLISLLFLSFPFITMGEGECSVSPQNACSQVSVSAFNCDASKSGTISCPRSINVADSEAFVPAPGSGIGYYYYECKGTNGTPLNWTVKSDKQVSCALQVQAR